MNKYHQKPKETPRQIMAGKGGYDKVKKDVTKEERKKKAVVIR